MRAVLASFALLLVAGLASAQSQCAPYVFAAEFMKSQGQALISRGAVNAGVVIEQWANAQTGDFTIVAVGPDNMACLITLGTEFETVFGDPV